MSLLQGSPLIGKSYVIGPYGATIGRKPTNSIALYAAVKPTKPTQQPRSSSSGAAGPVKERGAEAKAGRGGVEGGGARGLEEQENKDINDRYSQRSFQDYMNGALVDAGSIRF